MPYQPQVSETPNAGEVRTLLKGAADYLLGLQKTEADKRDDSWKTDVRSAKDFINAYDDIEKGLTAGERVAPEGPKHAFDEVNHESRSLGGRYTETDEYLEWAKNDSPNKRMFPKIEVRTLLDEAGSDNAAKLLPVGSPYLPPQNVNQQRLFVRDVITVQGTTLASVPYVRELNSATNASGASATAEGQAKWEAVMEFEQDDAPIRKITAWIPATTEILADAPTLRGYIDNRMAYMLKLREEQQVLNGVGVAPHLKGIRQFSGVQTQTTVADDLPAVVGQSMSKIEQADGFASAVALNPIDFWNGVLERHSTQFDNGFGGNAPAVLSGITWGQPAVRTKSMESGKLLVGDFRQGATLFDRQSITIDTSESHSTFFTENKVAIRAEERIGLAVHRPDWFCVGTITWT